MVQHILGKPEVAALVTRVEEATRSTDEGVKYFIEPAPGTRARACSKRHHIIFGRRGSGKSSLLRKVVADATQERRPVVYVDMEEFKGHSYPDVLVSVLIRALTELSSWLNTVAILPATKTTFWSMLRAGKPTTRPHDQKTAIALRASVDTALSVLKQVLHAADSSELRSKSLLAGSETLQETARVGGKLGASGATAEASLVQASEEQTAETLEVVEIYKASKEAIFHLTYPTDGPTVPGLGVPHEQAHPHRRVGGPFARPLKPMESHGLVARLL